MATVSQIDQPAKKTTLVSRAAGPCSATTTSYDPTLQKWVQYSRTIVRSTNKLSSLPSTARKTPLTRTHKASVKGTVLRISNYANYKIFYYSVGNKPMHRIRVTNSSLLLYFSGIELKGQIFLSLFLYFSRRIAVYFQSVCIRSIRSYLCL